MAYVAEDLIINVRGMCSPSESFSNTWAFVPSGATPDPQACADALRTFYAEIAATWLPTEWSAVGATMTFPFTGNSSEADWSLVVGAATDDIVPSQLAIRVSLSGATGVRGGPFLSGFNKLSIAEDGLVDAGPITLIGDEVVVMATTVLTSDYALGIHRPTVPSVELATQVRVGERWDVIRRRGNDTPEGYYTLVLP